MHPPQRAYRLRLQGLDGKGLSSGFRFNQSPSIIPKLMPSLALLTSCLAAPFLLRHSYYFLSTWHNRPPSRFSVPTPRAASTRAHFFNKSNHRGPWPCATNSKRSPVVHTLTPYLSVDCFVGPSPVRLQLSATFAEVILSVSDAFPSRSMRYISLLGYALCL